MEAGLRHGVDPPKGEGQWLVSLSNLLVALRVPLKMLFRIQPHGPFTPRSIMNGRSVVAMRCLERQRSRLLQYREEACLCFLDH
jgi:hypothetical protein